MLNINKIVRLILHKLSNMSILTIMVYTIIFISGFALSIYYYYIMNAISRYNLYENTEMYICNNIYNKGIYKINNIYFECDYSNIPSNYIMQWYHFNKKYDTYTIRIHAVNKDNNENIKYIYSFRHEKLQGARVVFGGFDEKKFIGFDIIVFKSILNNYVIPNFEYNVMSYKILSNNYDDYFIDVDKIYIGIILQICVIFRFIIYYILSFYNIYNIKYTPNESFNPNLRIDSGRGA